MINTLRIKYYNGKQYIPDPKKAEVDKQHRGLPVINSSKCTGCMKCLDVCPAQALELNPLRLDMGACIFCGDCQRVCPEGSIRFTNFHKLAADSREKLIITEGINSGIFQKKAVQIRKEIKKLFGRSIKFRQVSAGGCNGCEFELNACSNVNFDMGRYGIEFVASPRHADGIVITGPVSANMAQALIDAYECVPEPKLVILTGACAISSGIFKKSDALDRSFLEKVKIDLYIPGCPTHPLNFINGILSLIGR